MSSNDTFRPQIGVKWIKSDSGTTYLCPATALDRYPNYTEQDLRSLCLDESENPQND